VGAASETRAFFRRANALSAAFMRRRGAVLGLSLLSVPAIALVDLSTGYELALSLLYVGPVVASTWVFGLRAGLVLSGLATAAWLGTDALAEHHYSNAIYRYWEGFIRLATFSLFAIIIEQLKRALARSDDRLIKVLEGLDNAICVIDPAAGSILYRNRRFDAAFRGETQEPAARQLLQAALLTESGEENVEELQLEERWFLVRGRWLSWIDERPVLLLSATDVTARRQVEALNREQDARLQATARVVAVGEIASSIAHELNQPLAAIASYVSGCLRRLRGGSANPQALVGALEQAGEQAERAGQIIRRVRDFVRSRQPVLTALDLNALVARVASTTASEAERHGVRLSLALLSGLPPAQADGVMIEQVILNLVRNAIEAVAGGPASGRSIDIITARAEPQALGVTVSDRGPGIAADVAGRLFEPFYTSKPEGMGLGLNICRSIVEFHGGRLWTTPRTGGGAEFHFTVPTVPGGR
ncbi:MAG: ATP-binding protein, partial [Betaproteobacteria bacterium]|nr:ATP-binding protein [Betaproteobacteria bacterium]